MKVFNIPPGHLVILDLALAGGFYEAMARIIKAGGDPQLRAERHKSDGGLLTGWRGMSPASSALRIQTSTRFTSV
jgi:hypothetical protein